MNENVTKITDVIHGTIYLSEIEKEIISTPLFNRLHYVSQTSTVYLTYPSNNSKRFDHSIGTMKLCGDIFYYSVANAEGSTISAFINDIKKELSKIKKAWLNGKMPEDYRYAYGDDNLARDSEKGLLDIASMDLVGGLYRQYIPTNIIKENWNYYLLMFQAVRLCGLLHDVGHPPFSHIVEFGLKSAYDNVADNTSLKKALKNILKNNNELHEEIGNVIFDGIRHSVFANIKNACLAYRYFYILVIELAKCILSEKNHFFKDIHRVVAGSLDGDRLDNINRDSFMTGFDKNLMNYNQLLNSMILIGNSSEGYAFCPNIKTLITVEECFTKRWRNYRCMTHHHKVIKTNYMLQMVVYKLSMQFCNDEKKMQINTSVFLPYNISGLWMPILETTSNKMQIVRFIQWNDHWLLSVLQKTYLEMFLHATEADRETQLYYFLEEIIESKKNYSSLIKRYEDYRIIDDAFTKEFDEYLKESSNKYESFEKQVRETNGSINCPINIDGFIQEFIELNLKKDNGSFLSSRIAYLVSCFLPKNNLFEIIGEEIRGEFFGMHRDKIDDCFLVAKKLKTGTDNLLCLYDAKTKEKKRFVDISHIDETLQLEQSYIPEFYIYIKWSKNANRGKVDIINMKEEIGKIVANKVKNFIENNFMKYLQIEDTIL